jgi:hypothetical protein
MDEQQVPDPDVMDAHLLRHCLTELLSDVSYVRVRWTL